MNPSDKIFIAGARGMVGSALTRAFQKRGFCHLLTPSRQILDLTNQMQVKEYFLHHHPDIVVIAAAKVGGIWANQTYPAEFLYQNLMIASNLIHASHETDVKNLLFLGSSCIYPKLALQPIREDALLSGPLEPSNEAYAVAKIAGLKLCEYYYSQYGRRYLSAMPTNLYGPGDSYHPMNSHVIPGLMRRFHEAKMANQLDVKIWGHGETLREFLFVDDLAEACLLILEKYDEKSPINIGSGEEISILELAKLIKQVVGYQGDITNDFSKPDGTPRKRVDIQKIEKLGWKQSTLLKEGLMVAYHDFLAHCTVLTGNHKIKQVITR